MRAFFYGCVLLVCWGCGEDTETTSASSSTTANSTTATAQSTSGTGATGGNGAGGMNAGGSGGSVACGDMGLVCQADQICVKNVVYMGPTEEVTWTCADDSCAPEPLSCDCAGRICADGPTSCGVQDMVLVCSSGGVCASPDTPIATPSGERRIADLEAGDFVYSMHQDKLAIVPILRARRTRVHQHSVVKVSLASGRVLHISGMHPTAEGRAFRDLAPNDFLGSERIAGVATLPYAHDYTYDILPASDSGTYLAAGALIGSTLR